MGVNSLGHSSVSFCSSSSSFSPASGRGLKGGDATKGSEMAQEVVSFNNNNNNSPSLPTSTSTSSNQKQQKHQQQPQHSSPSYETLATLTKNTLYGCTICTFNCALGLLQIQKITIH